MKFFQTLLLMATMLLGSFKAHAAFTVTGKVQYTRNWGNISAGYNQAGSLLPSSTGTGVFPLKGVKVCASKAGVTSCNSDLVATHGFSDDNGNFTTVINGSGSGWTVTVVFNGRSLQTTTGDGYRVVAGQGQTTPLQANIGAGFTGSGTVNVGTLTFTNCSPAISTCANDFANGYAMVDYAVRRLNVDFSFGTAVTNFKVSADQLKAYTDRQQSQLCGLGGLSDFCCNFDFNGGDPRTCFHELGHQVFRQLRSRGGGATFGTFNGKCSDPADSGPEDLIEEAEANLTSMLMVYSEHNAGAFPQTVTLADFCSVNSAEPFEGQNKCDMCEWTPDATFYPIPSSACASPASGGIRRGECRALRAFIDLVDDVAVNGASCLSETADMSFSQLANYIAGFQNGTAEGQSHESAVGPPAQGNATSVIDAFSMMDIITNAPITNNNKWFIWQNSCSMPGDSDHWPANWFTGTGVGL